MSKIIRQKIVFHNIAKLYEEISKKFVLSADRNIGKLLYRRILLQPSIFPLVLMVS